jgi:hypothetical protein
MREKGHIKKKGYLEIHVVLAVNVNNKRILSLIKVRANERFHDDSKALPGLIEDIVKLDSIQ